jgi:bacterioferritin
VTNLNKINIGPEVEAQIKNDWAAEDGAVKAYNEGIRLAVEVGDNGTRELLESILKDEEAHIDWLEAQLDQIKQMGIQNYLVEQVG